MEIQIDDHAAIKMETIGCYGCGVLFAIPKRFLANKRKKAGSIWCPNGHEIHWDKDRGYVDPSSSP